MQTEVSSKERKELEATLAQGRRAAAAWRKSGKGFAKKYGGHWVAFHDGHVVAFSRNVDVLRRRLEDLGAAGEAAIVRYVPRARDRYVL